MCLPAAIAFADGIGAAVRGLRVEVNGVSRVGERLIEIGGPWQSVRTLSQIASSFAALRPTSSTLAA